MLLASRSIQASETSVMLAVLVVPVRAHRRATLHRVTNRTRAEKVVQGAPCVTRAVVRAAVVWQSHNINIAPLTATMVTAAVQAATVSQSGP
jgi:hypothetical protein